MPTLRQQIAASLDLPEPLTPWLPELFAGLTSLGSTPGRITSMLGEGGVNAGHHVLDLACGKGAAAVRVARALGCRVTGIDACGPFIDEARELARRHGVDRQCDFRVGDVGRGPRGRFDAAMMVGLFPFSDAAPLLRSRVVAGGCYLIDDAFLDTRARVPAELRGLPTRTDIHDFVAELGDAIIAEHIPTPTEIARLNRSIYRRLSAAARGLGRAQPRLKPHLSEFLARQRRANTLLVGPLRPAAWLIRRA